MYISRIIHNISHHPPHYIRYIPIMSQCNVPGLPKLDTAWRESGNEERLSRMVRILVAALWDENSIIKTSPIVCWLVVWNIFYFSIYWEFISSSQVTFTHIFQRGRLKPPTSLDCFWFPNQPKSSIVWCQRWANPLWILWKAMVDGDAGPQHTARYIPPKADFSRREACGFAAITLTYVGYRCGKSMVNG